MPILGGVGNAVAGGRVLTGSQSVTVNDLSVVIIGSNVAGHGIDEHSGPVMVTGSQSVTAGDIGVCVYGNHASCGHAMTCNSDVEVGL